LRTGIFVNIYPGGDSYSPVNRIACGYPDGIVERLPEREQSVDIGMMQEKDGVESWGSRISMETERREWLLSTGNRWVTHMSCTSNQDMDAVVDTFETVGLALSISSGMIAEGFPVVNLSQHGVGVICNIPLRIAKNPIKEKVFIFEQEESLKQNDALFNEEHVVGGCRFTARRTSKGGTPPRVRPRERRVDGIKIVVIQRVVHNGLVAVWSGNGNQLQFDYFGRGHGVFGPVPIRLAKLVSSVFPGVLIDLVSLCNFYGLIMKNLLEESSQFKWIA